MECPRFFLVFPLYSGQKAEICSRTALDHSLSLPRKLPRGNSIEVSGEFPDTSADSVETAVRGTPRQLAGELPAGLPGLCLESFQRARRKATLRESLPESLQTAARRYSRQLSGKLPASFPGSSRQLCGKPPDSFPESSAKAGWRACRELRRGLPDPRLKSF